MTDSYVRPPNAKWPPHNGPRPDLPPWSPLNLDPNSPVPMWQQVQDALAKRTR